MENISNGHENTQHTSSSASAAGISVLNDMQEKLHYAEDDLQRMEDESGTPRNAEQTANTDAYATTSQRIKKILLIARQMLPPDDSPSLPLF